MKYKHEILHYLCVSILATNKDLIQTADQSDECWYELFFLDDEMNREILEKSSNYNEAFDSVGKFIDEYRFDRLRLGIFSGEGNAEDVVELFHPEEIYDSICGLHKLNKLKYIQIGSVENPLSDNPEYKKEHTGNGFVFKDEIAFEYFNDRVCYVAELEGNDEFDDYVGSSYSDFLEICEGDTKLALDLFEEVDWQHPSTLYNDWDLHGRFDENEQEKEKPEEKEPRSPANYVSSFFYYMWNAWCESECETVFGGMYWHFWEKWCAITTKYETTHGAGERFYAELSESNREQLVNRACEVYERGTRIN